MIKQGYLIFNGESPLYEEEFEEWKKEKGDFYETQRKFLEKLREGDDYFDLVNHTMCGDVDFLLFSDKKIAEEFSKLSFLTAIGAEEISNVFYSTYVINFDLEEFPKLEEFVQDISDEYKVFEKVITEPVRIDGPIIIKKFFEMIQEAESKFENVT